MAVLRALLEVDGQVGDVPDPGAFLAVIAILVGGMVLLGLGAWYSARRRPPG